MQGVSASGNGLSSLFDSKTSWGASQEPSQTEQSFQTQLNDMNQSAIKLGSLIMKLETLIETNPALKTGD